VVSRRANPVCEVGSELELGVTGRCYSSLCVVMAFVCSPAEWVPLESRQVTFGCGPLLTFSIIRNATWLYEMSLKLCWLFVLSAFLAEELESPALVVTLFCEEVDWCSTVVIGFIM